MLTCPFCGATESDRVRLEGRLFVVFPCAFTPEVDPSLPEAELQSRLDRTGTEGSAPYFRSMCDRLHLYVTAGEGGRRLQPRTREPDHPRTGRPSEGAGRSAEPGP
ncbi:MAG TPA: hypothetical protein VJQ43_00450 [Thermoplasmata archaeon]|nr:hypothetical protein [Thermoplasmata archaeon]